MSLDLQTFFDFCQKSEDGSAPQKQEVSKAVPLRPWREILLDEFKSIEKVDQFQRFLIASGVYKDIASPDVGLVRLAGLYPVISQIYNPATKFLNWLKTRPTVKFVDYQEKWNEENIGNDILAPFNMDGTLPAVRQGTMKQRSNTLTAIGQGMNLSWMAQELAKKGPFNRDEYAKQLSNAFQRLERTMNAMLLSNTEQTSEAVPNVPQLGGFVTRSTLNGQATGGANLTDNYLQTAVQNIANQGYGIESLTDLVGYINGGTQMQTLESLIINKYPGTDPMTKYAYDGVLKGQTALQGDAYWKDAKSGHVIPFIRDDQMPVNTVMLFRANYPQMGLFSFQGNEGYHVVQRPVTAFFDYDVAFVLFSLVDQFVESRALITGTP